MQPDKFKNTFIQIRVTEEEKNTFYKICSDNLMTPAHVIRKLIKDWSEKMSIQK